MILQINRDWRIISDPQQWIVQERNVVQEGKTAGTERWISRGYFSDPAQAAVWAAQRRIRDLPGTYPAADSLELLGEALSQIVRETRKMVRESRPIVEGDGG